MTQASKWIPGPWFAHFSSTRNGPDERHFWYVSPSGDPEDFAPTVAASDGDISDEIETHHANANLIAAAPELFVALATVLANHHLDYLDKDFESIPYVIEARRALNKARGKL